MWRLPLAIGDQCQSIAVTFRVNWNKFDPARAAHNCSHQITLLLWTDHDEPAFILIDYLAHSPWGSLFQAGNPRLSGSGLSRGMILFENSGTEIWRKFRFVNQIRPRGLTNSIEIADAMNPVTLSETLVKILNELQVKGINIYTITCDGASDQAQPLNFEDDDSIR
jgi:hypothetical protein